MDIDKLNEKLAEWAGLPSPESGFSGDPLGISHIRIPRPYPNFTESLDACFKWLVPESSIDDIRFILFASSWGALSCIIEAKGKKYQSWAGDPRDKITPELVAKAFCLAFEKLIKEGK